MEIAPIYVFFISLRRSRLEEFRVGAAAFGGVWYQIEMISTSGFHDICAGVGRWSGERSFRSVHRA